MKSRGYITILFALLEVLQSSLGGSFCFVEEIFRYMYMVVVTLRANPGHFQFKFLLLCVVVNEVDADKIDERRLKVLELYAHSCSLHYCLAHRQFVELQLFKFCLRELSTLAHRSTVVALTAFD